MSMGLAVPVDKPTFKDTTCGHIVGILLILYGMFDTFLFYKFTPVYMATQCGDQTAALQEFSIGSSIKVGLEIGVRCWNPNAYEVQIMTSVPGRVYVGADRRFSVGELTLLTGSALPQQGTGDIRVRMNAELSEEQSQLLLPHFLTDAEIPMFLELQFEVGVDINFGMTRFGTSAPFKKKCGMLLSGLLVNTATRLGPMVCRDSFQQLDGNLPHVGEAHVGTMSFSGAQMDPDRIAMGEMAKNVSIIGLGGLAYIFGFLLTFHWIKTACSSREAPEDVERSKYLMNGQRSCFRATSGNFVDAQRSMGKPGSLGHALGYFAVEGGMSEQPGGTSCYSIGPMISFISCGALGGKRREPPPPGTTAPRPAYFQPSCMRAESGNVVTMMPPSMRR